MNLRRTGRRRLLPARDHLFLFVCLACCIGPVSGIVSSDSFVVGTSKKKGAHEFAKFGFDAGGYMEVDLELTKPADMDAKRDYGTYLVACTEEPLSQAKHLGNREEICYDQLPTTGCNHWVLGHGRHYVYEQMNERLVVYLAVINCNENTVVVDKVAYKLVNPNGEHLGTGYQPLPTMYMSFLLLWLALAMLQGVNWMCFKNFITYLHKLMLLVPCLKLIQLALGVLKWQRLSAAGTSDEWMKLVYIVSSVIAQSLTFAVLLLIGKGWLITRRILPSAERQATLVSIFMLIALFFAYYLITSFSFFALAIMHMAILAFILSSIARNVRLLKMQIVSLQSQSMDVGNTPVQTKAHMYRAFQVTMFMYVINKIVFQMLMLFLQDMPWLSYFFTELVEVFLWASVGFTFRLRVPNPFNTGALPLMVNNGFITGGDMGFQRMNDSAFPVDDGRESSPRRRHVDGSRLPHIVVVENPPTIRDGRIVRNVAVGAALTLEEKKAAGTEVNLQDMIPMQSDALGPAPQTQESLASSGVGVMDADGGRRLRGFDNGMGSPVALGGSSERLSASQLGSPHSVARSTEPVVDQDTLVAVDLAGEEDMGRSILVPGIRVGTATNTSPQAHQQSRIPSPSLSRRTQNTDEMPLLSRSGRGDTATSPSSAESESTSGSATPDIDEAGLSAPGRVWPGGYSAREGGMESNPTMAAAMAAAGIVVDNDVENDSGDAVVPFEQPSSPHPEEEDLTDMPNRLRGAW